MEGLTSLHVILRLMSGVNLIKAVLTPSVKAVLRECHGLILGSYCRSLLVALCLWLQARDAEDVPVESALETETVHVLVWYHCNPDSILYCNTCSDVKQ